MADFSRVLAGPYATMLLGDLGATVIKVERPDGGDDTRAWGPPWSQGLSTYFQSANRNKSAVAVDLHSAYGREFARELCRRSDVVVENFRTGTMARLGLAAVDVLETNPHAVYCSITGFGSGAGADLPGYDVLVQAAGGLMSVTGAPGGRRRSASRLSTSSPDCTRSPESSLPSGTATRPAADSTSRSTCCPVC